MAKELIINASLPEVRIALMEDGRIQELLIERDSEKGIVGNIYKGRVTRVLPGMQAAFVDVGLDKAAFLYVDDIFVHPKVMGEDAYVEDQGVEDHGGDDQDYQGQEQQAEAVDPAKPRVSFLKPNATEVIEGEAAPAESENQESSEATAETAPETTEVSDAELEHAAVMREMAGEIDSAQLESHAADHAENELTADDADEGFDEEIDFDMEVSGEEDFEGENEDDFDDSTEEDSDDSGEESDDFEGNSSERGEQNEEGVIAAAAEGEAGEQASENTDQSLAGLAQNQGRGRRGRNRNRRRRGGKGRDQKDGNRPNQFAAGESFVDPELMPDPLNQSLSERGDVESDRAAMENEGNPITVAPRARGPRKEFKESRNRDRRIKTKHSRPRAQANIADLLKEGQEVIVQVAKDPIATKGARLTCHVSLPGRHLVCMPTINHVGVSRRIERDDERRRLRDFVERNRTRNLGFIVRTASGGKDPESWIKQDIDYLTKLWGKICHRADEVSAPAIVYEDLNSVLRSIRDWVNEDIDKIIVDSRYHYNELQDFAERFMPSLIGKIELYQGDIPVFDAYGLSSELYRSLERRVWLKSGGYIVIDQAEALVAIDVNTGRFVGKKNLEDTILKTNIEAAEEIAYQLRLRNCGGIIICDFIDMERDENKMRVYRALEEALRKDRARPTIQKISELGLVEMTRKRTRDTIIRTLCEPCSHCEGKGFGKSKLTVAYEILRESERLGVDREAKKILISAHESVIDILAIDLRDALDTLERRYNKTVYLQAILDFHNEQYEVVTDRPSSKKQNVDIARQLRIDRDRSERKEKQKQRQKEVSSRDGEEDDAPQEPRENRGGRNRNRNRNDRNDRGDRNDRQKPEVEAAEGVEAAPPKPRPEGMFVARPKPPIEPAAEKLESSDETSVQMADGGDLGDDQGQPDAFNQAPRAPQGNRPRYQPTGMEDEDQLAYLRAQAAQDAALSGYGTNSGNQGGNQQNRNNNRNNRNNRNHRGGGRGNNRGNNDRGAGRFRQQRGGANPGNSQEAFRPTQAVHSEVSASSGEDDHNQ